MWLTCGGACSPVIGHFSWRLPNPDESPGGDFGSLWFVAICALFRLCSYGLTSLPIPVLVVFAVWGCTAPFIGRCYGPSLEQTKEDQQMTESRSRGPVAHHHLLPGHSFKDHLKKCNIRFYGGAVA